MVVTPVASHLATILSVLGGDGSAVTIEDVACPRALVIQDGERYDAQILVQDHDGAQTVRVQSLLEATRGHWQTHLSGRVVAAPPAQAAPPDIAAFVGSAERHIAGDDLYAYFRALGYTLGPSFRWIADAWIRGSEAIVRYARPASLADRSDDELHPGLIEACFHGVASFLAGGDPRDPWSVAIPVAAARLSFHGRPAASDELWGHVRALESEPLEHGRLRVEAADLHMFPRLGTSLLAVNELRVRHVPRAFLEQSLRSAAGHAASRPMDPANANTARLPTARSSRPAMQIDSGRTARRSVT
jgi:hypothetical protein